MAVTKGTVSLRINVTADDKSEAQLQKIEKRVERLIKKELEAGKQLKEIGSEGQAGFLGLGKGASAAFAKLGLVTQGISSIISGAKEMGEALIEGAQAGDRIDILRKDIEGVDELLQRVQSSSAGMFREADVTKAIAEFKQFQIPIEEMDRVLAAVAKQSVRTGQEAGFLLESITSGIARGSALRLDNLGILIKEEQVTRDYAAALGTTSAELSQADKKAALLAESLEQLEANNINVDLTDSRTAAITRLGNTFENLWSDVTTGLATAGTDLINFLGIMPPALERWEQSLKDATGEAGRAATGLEQLARTLFIDINPIVLGFEALGAALFDVKEVGDIAAETTQVVVRELFSEEEQARRTAAAMNELAKAIGATATASEERAVESARIAAEEKALAENLAKQKPLIDFLSKSTTEIRREREATIRFERDILTARTSLKEIEEDRAAAQIELLQLQSQLGGEIEDASSAASENAAEGVAINRLRLDFERTLKDEALKELEINEAQLRFVRGISDEQHEIAQIKKQINSLDKENAFDLLQIIDLTARIADLQAEENERREKQRRKRRGRRRKAEAETLADIIDLEQKRLELAGELNFEQQEALAFARATAEIAQVDEEHRKRKITAGKAANREAQIELDLRKEIRDIREEELEAEIRQFEQGQKELEQLEAQIKARQEATEAVRTGLGLGPSMFEEQRAEITGATEAGQITEKEAAPLMARVDAAQVVEKFDIITAAAQRAAAAEDEAAAAFGRLGEAVVESGDQIVEMAGQIAEAMEASGKATAGAVASGIAVAGKLAAAVIKDEQAKAVIMGLVETAASVAAFATEDFVGGALHAVAAGLYFAAAGDTSAAKKASAGTSQQRRPAVAQPPPTGGRAARTVININAPAAVIGGSPQEVATQLDRLGETNRGTGFEVDAA
jgi:hypothetical protein